MRNRSYGLFVVATLIALPAHAEEKKCQLQRYAQMPVRMVGTQGVIEGSINGVPARFLADSGAFFSILSRHAVEKFNLKLANGKIVPVSGVGGIDNMRVSTAEQFTINGLLAGQVIKNVDFLVSNNFSLNAADGIIGQNVLGSADVEYDLANGFIRLFKSENCKGNVFAYWAGGSGVAEVEIDRTSGIRNQLVGDAKLNGKKIRVVFDTGASRSVLELNAAARAGIEPESDDVVAAGYGQGIGKKVNERWIARFDTLDLGGEVIKNARLAMGNISVSNADMLLGADFFLSHRVYVATKQKKVFFTYNGGQVFDLRPPSASVAANDEGRDKPTDAAGFRRRGMASAGRNDFPSAIADFDEAIKLEPANAENYVLRAGVHMRSVRPKLAMDDFEQALKLRPDYLAALIGRGALRLTIGNVDGGRADLDAASKLAPNDATVQWQIAEVFVTTQRHEDAIDRFDAWIAANPKDARIPRALMQRCWSRALTGKELDLALADCDAALRKGPEYSQAFDGRAFVHLQRGNIDKSIDDYKESIELQPKNAFSLYGLGIAEIKKGLKPPKGTDNIQAALAINPRVAEIYKVRGLAP